MIKWCFSIVIAVLLLLSCSGVQKAKKISHYIVGNTTHINLGNSNNPIQFVYSGCGGFLIKQKEEAILIDPYFSNVSPMSKIPFKKLKTDTTVVDNFFNRHFQKSKDQKGNIKMLLVGHAHYDHLADVPSIYERNCNQDSTSIIGGITTKHILKGANIVADTIIPNKFIYSRNRRIRVWAILSDHAPHLLLGIKLISSKSIHKDLSVFPNKVRQFPEGETYNFLIDFLNEQGQPIFRVFSNATAACSANIGFPPKNILQEKQVDVLLLCVASHQQVKSYPETILQYIQPRHIILNHWENFFVPIKDLLKKPRVVPATNVNAFMNKIMTYSNGDTTKFTLPLPLTQVNFYY